uniref:Uncharacterized protein n=1 Tax=Panagrolaimus davidi TaxID=227884 RepID=A0A914PH80_9BILA
MKVSFHTFIKFRSFDENNDVKEILSLQENSLTEEAFSKLNNVQLISYANPPMLNSRRIIEEHKKRLNLSPYSSYPTPASSYTSPTTVS